MSVLACCRNNCENIMCDLLSPNYGYICFECYNELCSRAGTIEIADFMEENKSRQYQVSGDIREQALNRIKSEFF